jgi:hypothetical protein
MGNVRIVLMVKKSNNAAMPIPKLFRKWKLKRNSIQ